MSLLQLLTTGRCLEGLKDTEPRYRLTSQRLLPKFGSDKNPFCAKEKAVAPPTHTVGAVERDAMCLPNPKALAAAQTARPDSAERPTLAAPRLAAARASAKSWEILAALRQRTTALGETWSGKLKALLARRARKPARVATPFATKLAVQGELSLDRIKVVRNDLSDADLEVIGAKPAPSAAVNALARQSAERAEFGALTWRRLAARVCGMNKS